MLVLSQGELTNAPVILMCCDVGDAVMKRLETNMRLPKQLSANGEAQHTYMHVQCDEHTHISSSKICTWREHCQMWDERPFFSYSFRNQTSVMAFNGLDNSCVDIGHPSLSSNSTCHARAAWLRYPLLHHLITVIRPGLLLHG